MARPQAPKIQLDAVLQPVAAPVNTYVPVKPRDTGLMELARGLSQLDSGLREFVQDRQKKAADLDSARAKQAFYQNNMTGYAEAVRKGLIPAGASPIFVQAYKAAEGDAAGIDLQTAFLADMQKWDGRNSGDPAAFRKFASDWLKNKVQNNDPYFLKGVMPHIERIYESGSRAFASENAQNEYNKGIQAHTARTSAAINQADVDGLRRPEGTDYEALWSSIMQGRENALASGVRMEDYDKTTIATITSKAIELRDPKLLELLDKNLPGTDYKISDTPGGLRAKQAAIETLEAMGAKAIVQQRREAEAEKERLKDEFTRNILDKLSDDPNAELSEEMLMQAEKVDPTIRIKVGQWRESVRKDRGNEDDTDLLHTIQRIASGDGMEAITDAVRGGVIKKGDTFQKLYAFEKSYREGGKKVLTGDAYSNMLKTIAGRLTRSSDLNEFGVNVKGLSDDALRAQSDYQRILLDWYSRNRDASEEDIHAAQQRIGQEILKGVTPGSLAEAPSYQASKAEGPPTQQVMEGAQRQQQATQPQAQAPAASADELATRATPEDRQLVEREAARRGTPPSMIWERLLRYQQDATQQRESLGMNNSPPGVEPQGYAPTDTQVQQAPDLGQIQQQLTDMVNRFTSTPEGKAVVDSVRGLIGLIGSVESPRGYNQMFGQYSGRMQDLTSMTLNEVLSLQQSRVRKGVASSAAGRGQFLRKTLLSLKQELGLSGNEQFNEALQDRLMVALMQRRGLDQFMAGKLTATQFAKNLSKEWAGLPDPSTGRSYYAGDGLNKSGLPVRRVLQALESMRAAQSKG